MTDVAWQEFDGKWNVVDSEKMEDFLAEVGVPYLIRKVASNVSSLLTIKVAGDNKLRIQMTTKFYSQPDNEYHINGPETTVDLGKKYTCKTTWEGDKLVFQFSGSEDGSVKPQKITRQIINGELHQIMEIGKVVAKQRHVRAT